MTNRHNFLLKQLNIIQWKFKDTTVLHDSTRITKRLLNNPILLIISDLPLPVNDPLINDVARSMLLSTSQIYGLIPAQLDMLPVNFYCYSWWLGVDITHYFGGFYFQTSALIDFSYNTDEKRKLWRQISNYKYHHHITFATY